MADYLISSDPETSEETILAAARRDLPGRDLVAFFEHDQWWVEDKPTGAQWSCHDCEPGGLGFEQVTEGKDD